MLILVLFFKSCFIRMFVGCMFVGCIFAAVCFAFIQWFSRIGGACCQPSEKIDELEVIKSKIDVSPHRFLRSILLVPIIRNRSLMSSFPNIINNNNIMGHLHFVTTTTSDLKEGNNS